MTAIVTIFKDELRGKDKITESIYAMSYKMHAVGNVYIVIPKSGRLFDLLNELKEHKIAYGTHFDTSDPGQTEQAVESN